MCQVVSARVAPKAIEPYLNIFGTDLKAFSISSVMKGRIMMPMAIPATRAFSDCALNPQNSARLRMFGDRKTTAKYPYTTVGMPHNISKSVLKVLRTLLSEYSLTYIADSRPRGNATVTDTITIRSVPLNKGNIPKEPTNWPFITLESGFHVVPKIKSESGTSAKNNFDLKARHPAITITVKKDSAVEKSMALCSTLNLLSKRSVYNIRIAEHNTAMAEIASFPKDCSNKPDNNARPATIETKGTRTFQKEEYLHRQYPKGGKAKISAIASIISELILVSKLVTSMLIM
ncbi:hypothetical protein APHNP_0619 [Anaplasma phagocytophilum str. ApNP]|uniref:Uncharacterized protein n=2 Tax=Anaplasma phagocytophilum TaxID=948 RepID=A0A0F3NHK3_ANAPH|nr:hypothetical protein APHNP_0619 [Anaplasma phagocytophilum str. ApNP]